MQIHVGNAHDIASIMPVMDSAFDPAFGEAWTAAQCLSTLSLCGAQLLLAKKDNAVTGFALSRWVGDEEELLLIGVLPANRRNRVGQLLIDSLLQKSSDANRKVVFLEVRHGNTAEHFYHSFGFRSIGRRPSYYRSKDGQYCDAITMALNF